MTSPYIDAQARSPSQEISKSGTRPADATDAGNNGISLRAKECPLFGAIVNGALAGLTLIDAGSGARRIVKLEKAGGVSHNSSLSD